MEKHVCESCGKVKDDVEWTTDPFAEEIHDKTVWMWLCRECWQEYADDI